MVKEKQTLKGKREVRRAKKVEKVTEGESGASSLRVESRGRAVGSKGTLVSLVGLSVDKMVAGDARDDRRRGRIYNKHSGRGRGGADSRERETVSGFAGRVCERASRRCGAGRRSDGSILSADRDFSRATVEGEGSSACKGCG